jgi:hypothetical protein
MSTTDLYKAPRTRAVLDDAHIGDIRGALGTIRNYDIAPRRGWWARLRTLLAILGPGLIVMVGDNDAGAFGTYTQAGQDYGTALLWTLLLLVPVLYVNQEMVLRLGAVTGVGQDDRRVWIDAFGRMIWRMPPLDQLPPAQLTPLTRIWLGVLRGYLVVAGGLVLWRIVELAIPRG